MGMTKDPQPYLFNTPLEAGMRAVLILEAFEPSSFDIATLALLDYYIVHTSDAGGPSSIHPPIEPRRGEYFVRRHLVEQGVTLMARASILEQVADQSGISYRSCETASAMIDLMESDYNKKLWRAAKWLAAEARSAGGRNFIESLKFRIERWSHEVVARAQR